MIPLPRILLLGALALAAAATVAAARSGQRWAAARRVLGRDAVAVPMDAVAAGDAAAVRIATVRDRLPAAGSAASRAAQRSVLELVQAQGLEIGGILAQPDRPRPALPGIADWPGAVIALDGRASFAAAAAILDRLSALPAVVLPLEVELTQAPAVRAADHEAAAVPADGRLHVRLVLAL